ncbi:MAG: MOSC domain-containing protein [Ignavibacteriales bacterium]|nr:MOSC domain-containing protein [Ignavibacteriales bacterium]
MKQKIGIVKEIYRYPVKSMAAEPITSATLGFRGIENDRRFAFIIVENKTNFPFLNASKLPKMIGYKPYVKDSVLRIITPSGEDLELQSETLRNELSNAYGSEVRLVNFKNGIFDEAEISLISMSTIGEIEKLSGNELDIRQFRQNIIVELTNDIPFYEDEWIGKIVGNENFSVGVTMRDLRCVMLNIDPNTQTSNPEILKTVGKLNQACAGIYGSVIKAGMISVGDELYLH